MPRSCHLWCLQIDIGAVQHWKLQSCHFEFKDASQNQEEQSCKLYYYMRVAFLREDRFDFLLTSSAPFLSNVSISSFSSCDGKTTENFTISSRQITYDTPLHKTLQEMKAKLNKFEAVFGASSGTDELSAVIEVTEL